MSKEDGRFTRRTFLKSAALAAAGELLAACKTPEPETKREYVCPDGRVVNDPLQCTPTPTSTTETKLLPTQDIKPPITTPKPEEQTLFIKGVDTMNQSKDKLRDPTTIEDKRELVSMAKSLGITYMTVDTPYDSPKGTDSLKETRDWITAIREAGLHVSHRHMFTQFEGMYDQTKVPVKSMDYISKMQQWMRDNRDLIQPGDLWTPMPEPQNGGIVGANCDPNKQICDFQNPEEFNIFIQNLTNASRETLNEIGREDVQVACCGFDMYIATGNLNPDRRNSPHPSFLTDKTIQTLGTIAIDHYPQVDPKTGKRRTYAEDIAEFAETFPGVPLLLTEVGSIAEGDAEPIPQMFQDFKEASERGTLKGVLWWQIGPSDPKRESLVGVENDKLIPLPRFNEVKRGFEILPKAVNK